jgi:hypothetical protein
MARTFILLIWIIIIIFGELYPQLPPYKRIYIDSDISFSNILQADKTGDDIIYFTTPTSILKFDHHGFALLEKLNSYLNGQTITDSKINGNNKWILTGKNNLIRIYENGIKFYKLNLEEKGRNIIIIGDDIYILMTKDAAIFNINQLNNAQSNNPVTIIKGEGEILKLTQLEGTLLVIYREGIIQYKENKKLNYNSTLKGISAAYSDGKECFVAVKGEIIKIDPQKPERKNGIKITDEEIDKFIVDKRGSIWYLLKSGQIYYYKDNTNILINNFLKIGNPILNFFLEVGDQVLLSIAGRGLYIFHNFFITNYREYNTHFPETILSINKYKKNDVILGSVEEVYTLHEGKLQKLLEGVEINYIRDIKEKGKKIFICFAKGDDQLVKKSADGYDYIFIKASAALIKGDTLITGGWDNSIYYSHYQSPELKRKVKLFDDSLYVKVNQLYHDSSGKLWIGTTNGLIMIDEKGRHYFSDDRLSVNISAIAEKGGDILIAAAHGLIIYSNGKWFYKSRIDDIKIKEINALAIDREEIIWIGTANGLYSLKNGKVKYFNKENGLVNDEVLSLFYNREKNLLYAGTNEGISLINLNKIGAEIIKPPVIKYKIINTEIMEGENFIIEIESDKVLTTSKLLFEFKFSGDEKWIRREEPRIQLSSLSAGEYKIDIRGREPESEWSDPVQVNFSVIKPFYKSSFYFFTFTMIAVAGFTFFGRKRIIKIKEREKEKREMQLKILDLKQQSLTSLMNPHFLFNALTSIQYYVNEHKPEEVNNFIATFSKLLRMYINNADQPYITLGDEYYRLRLYLEIEKVRFSNFEYEFCTGEQIDPENLLIPNMIIQPFVENSIWHGLLPKGSGGVIVIDVRYQEDQLKISIEDNGVGLGKGKKGGKEKHISKGIDIIKERIQLLSGEEEGSKINIFDKELINGEGNGTVVEIILSPLLYKVRGKF